MRFPPGSPIGDRLRLPPYSALARPPLDHCVQFSPSKRMQANGNRLKGGGAVRANEEELETRDQKETLNVLRMFSLQERRLKGDMKALFK